MNKYKVIAFDLDDTLIDDTKSRKFAISKVSEYLQIPYTDDIGKSFIAFDNQFWHNWESGHILIPKGTVDFAVYLRSLRFLKFYEALSIDFPTAQHLYEMYTKYLGECIEPIPGARETLKILNSRNYRLPVVTNGVKSLVQHKLAIARVSDFITDIICAEDIGDSKPNPLFFEYFFKQCNCTKEQALIVGDSLTSDVLGGMKNGIDTCWFNPNHYPLPPEYKPTMEIDHLLELTRKL